MYVPPAFRIEDRDEIYAFVERNAFGTLVSRNAGTQIATHLPFVVVRNGENVVLRGHVARANPHWRELESAESLAIFLGPHAYVSPRWYESRDNVPTWDYMAVHAYGLARVVKEPGRVLEFLAELSDRYERSAGAPWRVDDLDERKRDAFLAAIVAFEMPVSRLEASFKLSQNRTEKDRAGVVAALLAEGRSDLAEEIRRR